MDAKNVYDYKAQILRIIADNELSVFSIEDIVSQSGKDYSKIKYAISVLLSDSQIYRIQTGLYCVRNFQNPHVIANAMLTNSIVAYWSALNLHGLTEQIPNMIYSQSSSLKFDKTVFNVRYKFVKVKSEKMFGSMQMGYGNEVFRVTDTEKTLLDCFDLPQYSGGYAELIRAFYSAKISSVRLLEYGLKMNNLSILKRMAFLSELFQMKGFTRFQQEVLKRMNQKYTLIDPFGENEGEFNAKWRVRLNISKENLLGIIQKIY
jgi:predicted transcriptional regulator of viral defense system